jgi:Ras-related protein Rab-1A
MYKRDFDHLAKVVIIGDSGTGKSALMVRSCDNTYDESYISTIGVDFRYQTISVDAKMVRLQIWDTAGQERFRTITATYYRNNDVVLIVYDVTNRASFDHIAYWIDECSKRNNKKYLIFLIATKCDIKDRCVTTQEGIEFAKKHNIPYFETSAKTGEGVENTFMEISRAVLLISDVPQAQPTSSIVPYTSLATSPSWFSKCSIL